MFAFPGAVGMPFSEGCNRMIQNNTAALIMSAEDFIEAMGWKVRGKMEEVRGKMEEGELFPEAHRGGACRGGGAAADE